MLHAPKKGLDTWVSNYADTICEVVKVAQATLRDGERIAIGEAIDWAAVTARRTHDAGNKLIFLGNGGSAGIASHMATDYSKNGNLRAVAFNDASALTCLGNDYGYEYVFAKQIEFHARAGDMIFAISSSGSSKNIVEAVKAAHAAHCTVLTLSGFRLENPLRNLGDMNLFLDSTYYGFVEIGHLMLCHAILDYNMEREGGSAAGLKR
jgi:D-sedoheptulose 7-phosphate isomerase